MSKLKELEEILNEFDCKLTDYAISQELKRAEKQKEQAECLGELVRLISYVSCDNLLSLDEETMRKVIDTWKHDVINQLIALRNTI